MRRFLGSSLLLTLVLAPAAAGAQTLTIRDLLALSEAGLGDDVLVALIEADRSVFDVGPYDVLKLRQQGLGDAVLIKMIESRPKYQPPVAEVAPARDDPQPVRHVARQETERQAPQPVVVTQTVVQEVTVEAPSPRYVQVPVYVPVPVRPRVPVREPEPVYWGFGGQRRPDTWQETKTDKTLPPKKTGGGM
jgi:hypothetical protein